MGEAEENRRRKMRALSLWQPWASAIAIGAKTIETRSFYTSYRGEMAIHAAKMDNAELREFFTSQVCAPLRQAGYASFEDLPLGAIVATCRIEVCLRADKVYGLTRQERDLGNYAPGRFAWVLTDICPLPKPIPARGSQGFWFWEGGPSQPGESFLL